MTLKSSEWIDAHAEKPPRCEKVLACWSDGFRYVAYWDGDNWLNSGRKPTNDQAVSFWMTMPEAPQQ